MPHNLQRIPEGTTHPCKCCGTVFTVERNPNRSGEFCSRPCALKSSRSKIRSHEQRIADDAKMIAGIRERQERDRVESAKQHEADLAEQRRKSDEEFARWKIREAEIAREFADEGRREWESDHSEALRDLESCPPYTEGELDREILDRYNEEHHRKSSN